ncbi:PAS domain S-box protein [Priestia megaterium]|nr:PAS domain S-box protein [Priestia megaterium]
MNVMNVNDSFILTSPTTLVSQVKTELSNYDYVIIFDKNYYIIGHQEQFMLNTADLHTPIIAWIQQINWPSSTVSTWIDLKTANINWNRPVLIQTPTQDSLIGVINSTEWINYLQDENEHVSSYFHTLAETINDAVTAVDCEGHVILWNTAAENTYKIAREKIIGQKIDTHFHDDAIVLHKILNEGRPIRGAYHKPNETTHVLINASPILKDNSIIGGIATEHDITNIVRLHEEMDVSVLIPHENPFSSFIGMNPDIQQAVEVAKKVASTDIPILITGEPGSGKEMLAQAIHYGGAKYEEEFLSLNCATIPPGLFDIELFGYRQDVFSNELSSKKAGKLEQANNGTLFIEEIDKMPLDTQTKLLHYLEKPSFYNIGGDELVNVQTRIIASTSVPLEDLIAQGQFHENLYYHLTVINIHIPPLRERKEDLPALTTQFIKEFSAKYKKNAPIVDPDVMNLFVEYNWPGNIRELRNIIERLILLNDTSVLTSHHLPDDLKKASAVNPRKRQVIETANTEKQLIQDTLQKTYGNKSAAADLLGISRGTLYNKLKEYGLS